MPSIIFLFSGQGAQYYQMGADLYANDSIYRAAFERCSDLAGEVRGQSLIDCVFGRPMADSDGYDDLEETNLALLAQGYATAQSLLARDIQPDALAGYSLGEITSAAVSGALELEQALGLLRTQARHVARNAPEAAMVAVLGSSSLMVEQPELARLGEVACINSPQHFVVTTPLANLAPLTHELSRLDVNWARLPVRYGFHGSLLDPAERGYAEHASHIEFHEPHAGLRSAAAGGPE
jgi:bacillaene synthase trans-acting acyltransferase